MVARLESMRRGGVNLWVVQVPEILFGLAPRWDEGYRMEVEHFEQRVAEEVGGAGLDAMVAGFYRRVRKDDLLGPMYPDDDWEGSEERLRLFLRFRLLGEQEYTLRRGHPRLRGRHMPFAIGEPERDRWLHLMAGAMDEAGVSGRVREELDAFFYQVADFMRNR